MKTALVQVKMEPELKEGAEKVFAELGLDTPAAVRMFFARVIREQELPFYVARSDVVEMPQTGEEVIEQIYDEIDYVMTG